MVIITTTTILALTIQNLCAGVGYTMRSIFLGIILEVGIVLVVMLIAGMNG
jgi:hypothetical protein